MQLSLAALALAAVLVLVMGAAIQRSTTCMVAAVDEFVISRKATRARAMLLAGVWVGAILVAASFAGVAQAVPVPLLSWWPTVAGGVLLALGSVINRACVIGSVARLGNGDWSFLFTPLGLFGGFLAAFGAAGAMGVELPIAQLWLKEQMPLPAMPPFLMVPLLLAWLGWRAVHVLRTAPRSIAGRLWRLWDNCWSPLGATSLIGISFAFLFLLGGAWAYPDMLARLAHGGWAQANPLAFGLFVLLLAGSVAGGWATDRTFLRLPRAGHCLRSLGGGFVMALGSVLIPGSNDGFVLLGVPLLWTHAFAALLVMALTIATVRLLALRRRPALRQVTPV